MPYVKRNIEKIFREMEKTFPVVMVIGPGEVGKKSLFEKASKFGIQVGNGGVICMKQDIFPIDKNNNYIPVEYL